MFRRRVLIKTEWLAGVVFPKKRIKFVDNRCCSLQHYPSLLEAHYFMGRQERNQLSVKLFYNDKTMLPQRGFFQVASPFHLSFNKAKFTNTKIYIYIYIYIFGSCKFQFFYKHFPSLVSAWKPDDTLKETIKQTVSYILNWTLWYKNSSHWYIQTPASQISNRTSFWSTTSLKLKDPY